MVKPKISESELNKMESQIETFENNIKSLDLDTMNKAPKMETEPQTKIAQADLEKSKDIYLKPDRVIGSSQKFNEKFRSQYEFDKQYVCFIAENLESKDTIEIWTRPYGGLAAEFWKVPVGKPIWGPRYLAEQIKRCAYHRLTMQNHTTTSDGMGQYYGAITVDSTVQRLDARPASTKKSVFMGATNFA